jgi:hypothetical protein
MKNLLSNELDRYKILSNYNTKLTLTENTEIISKNSILNEQPTTLRASKAALRTLGLTLAKFTKMEVSVLEKILLMDESTFAKELTKEMKKDIKAGHTTMVSAKELSKIQVIREITSKKPTTVAEMNKIINDVKISNTTKFNALKLTPIRPNTSGKIKIQKVQTPTGGNKFWRKYKPMLAKIGKSKAFKYLMIAGGIVGGSYLAWRWFVEEGSKPFPDCLRNGISEEDFKVIVEGDASWVKIGQTGNKTIDLEGGGKFWDNGRFSTVNGRYDGKWEESDGGIDVIIEGTVYPISCDKFPPVDKCPEGQTWDGTKCVPNQTPPKPDEEITPVTPSPDEVTTTTTTSYTPEKNSFFGDDILN